MMKLTTILSLLLSFPVFSKELSFDCEGIYTYGNGTTETLTSKLDFDLDKMSGTRENTLGNVTSFYKVELTPTYLRGIEYNSWNTQPTETVYIDRKTLRSVVNGGIGKCEIVERNPDRQF